MQDVAGKLDWSVVEQLLDQGKVDEAMSFVYRSCGFQKTCTASSGPVDCASRCVEPRMIYQSLGGCNGLGDVRLATVRAWVNSKADQNIG